MTRRRLRWWRVLRDVYANGGGHSFGVENDFVFERVQEFVRAKGEAARWNLLPHHCERPEAVPTGAEISKVPLREYKPIGSRKRDADEPIARTLRTLGHVPFTWPAPNGYPDVAAAWVNSNNLLTRWNYAFALTTNRILEFDVALESFTHIDTPDVLVDEWSKRVLHRALPEQDRAKLIEHVRGDTSDSACRESGGIVDCVAAFSVSVGRRMTDDGEAPHPQPLSLWERGVRTRPRLAEGEGETSPRPSPC